MAAPCGGHGHMKNLERAIRELNLKGVLINSSHKGHYPDDDEARGFWELVQDLDIPEMIHPPRVGFGEERLNEYRLPPRVGPSAARCLPLSRLIVPGSVVAFSIVPII